MAVEFKTYTIEEFYQIEDLPENADKILELIDGEIVEKVVSFIPSEIGINIAFAFKLYLRENPIARVTGEAGGYTMGAGNVFKPDVALILKERLSEQPRRASPVAPDLAVEVRSPSDSKRGMRRKAEKHLESGTKIVWLVFPAEYVVEVYTPNDEDVQTISYDGVLDGGDVLPGFTLKVAEVFGPKEA